MSMDELHRAWGRDAQTLHRSSARAFATLTLGLWSHMYKANKLDWKKGLSPNYVSMRKLGIQAAILSTTVQRSYHHGITNLNSILPARSDYVYLLTERHSYDTPESPCLQDGAKFILRNYVHARRTYPRLPLHVRPSSMGPGNQGGERRGAKSSLNLSLYTLQNRYLPLSSMHMTTEYRVHCTERSLNGDTNMATFFSVRGGSFPTIQRVNCVAYFRRTAGYGAEFYEGCRERREGGAGVLDGHVSNVVGRTESQCINLHTGPDNGQLVTAVGDPQQLSIGFHSYHVPEPGSRYLGKQSHQ
ncbi:hypothetical protein EDC01DRAFT_124161 [Geopyxis carbonaria]|nr:hypothetical protein EDC01DRAFT_124161 [Geopyxis carbonaria]